MDALVPYLTSAWQWATGSAFAAALTLAVLGVVGFISVWAMFAIWLERKASADFQARFGPNRVGPFGLLQSLADGLKLAFKEDLVPMKSDQFLFLVAPAIAFCGAFAAFAAIPFSPALVAVDVNLGVFFVVAVTAVGVIGVLMAGWSSNNKWSLYGSMREAAQLVSYEIPTGLALMIPVLVTGSFNLKEIVAFQCAPSGGGSIVDAGLVYWSNHGWLAFYSPWTLIAFIVYYTASLAECKRAPFDLPEAESELVSGFHTEYSGLRFSFFFLEEYGMMFIVSAVAALVFLGGWQPLPFVSLNFTGLFGNLFFAGVFLAKTLFLVWVQIWLRWTLPRLRVDQVMTMGYKYLIPITLIALLAAALYSHLGVRYVPGIV